MFFKGSRLGIHGFTKLEGTFPSSTNLIAKNSTLALELAFPAPVAMGWCGASADESAKIFDFLCGLRELCGSGFFSDINLVKLRSGIK